MLTIITEESKHSELKYWHKKKSFIQLQILNNCPYSKKTAYIHIRPYNNRFLTTILAINNAVIKKPISSQKNLQLLSQVLNTYTHVILHLNLIVADKKNKKVIYSKLKLQGVFEDSLQDISSIVIMTLAIKLYLAESS